MLIFHSFLYLYQRVYDPNPSFSTIQHSQNAWMGSAPLLTIVWTLNNHCWWAMPNNSKPNSQLVLGMIHYWVYHIILNHHGMIAVIAIHNVISICSYGMILCQVCLCSPYLLHSYESWVVVKACTIQYWLILIGNDHNPTGNPYFFYHPSKKNDGDDDVADEVLEGEINETSLQLGKNPRDSATKKVCPLFPRESETSWTTMGF